MQTQREACKNKVGISYIFWYFADKQRNQENTIGHKIIKHKKEKKNKGTCSCDQQLGETASMV